MRKYHTITGLSLLSMLLFNACKSLDKLPYSPKISPINFLENEHHWAIHLGDLHFIWSQPSSTLIVFFASFITLRASYIFFKNANKEASGWFWGLGFFLTGIGAFFAGISYQAFAYEIKCNGKEFCSWTSWWEIIYLLLSVYGMNAFLIATSYTYGNRKYSIAIKIYAFLNAILYTLLILFGVMFENIFALSFEVMLLMSAPSLLFILILHLNVYLKNKSALHLVLLKTWLIFILVGFSYALYLMLGLTNYLWDKNIWFTENDVLHLGLIYWIYFIIKHVANKVIDLEKINIE